VLLDLDLVSKCAAAGNVKSLKWGGVAKLVNDAFSVFVADRVRQVLSGGEPGGVENRARIVIPTIQRPRATVHPIR